MPQSKEKKSLLIPLMITLTGFSVVVTVAVLIWNGPSAQPTTSLPEASLSEDKPESITLTGDTSKALESASISSQSTDENGRLLSDVEHHNKLVAAAALPSVASPRFSEKNPPQLVDFEISEATRKQMTTLAESDNSTSEKISQFKSMISESSDSGVQLLAITHLSRLVSDDEYGTQLGSELIKPDQPELVLLALYQDIRSRPPGVCLPVLMDVMESKKHPLAKAASDVIRAYLGDSFVEDPEALRQALNQRLNGNSGGL
jgi:hypothetical protein